MKPRGFIVLWVLAVVATVAAFVVHLGLRGRIVDLGYKLGRVRAEQARLREINRVLDLEAASHRAPQRVEMVARTLLGMTPPSADRLIPVRHFFPRGEEDPDPTAGASAAGQSVAVAASASAVKPGMSPWPQVPSLVEPNKAFGARAPSAGLPAPSAPLPNASAPGGAQPDARRVDELSPPAPPPPIVLPPADPAGAPDDRGALPASALGPIRALDGGAP